MNNLEQLRVPYRKLYHLKVRWYPFTKTKEFIDLSYKPVVKKDFQVEGYCRNSS